MIYLIYSLSLVTLSKTKVLLISYFKVFLIKRQPLVRCYIESY